MKNKLIIYENQLPNAKLYLKTTEKLIANFQEEQLEELFLSHPLFFINHISTHFPLTEEIILKFHHLLEWQKLKSNRFFSTGRYLEDEHLRFSPDDAFFKFISNLNFNEISVDNDFTNAEILKSLDYRKISSETIIENSKILSWWKISGLTTITWSIDFISTHQNLIKWKALSSNSSLTWNERLIEMFEENWDWKVLSENENLPWNSFLIRRFKDKWNWGGIGDSQDIGHLERLKELILQP